MRVRSSVIALVICVAFVLGSVGPVYSGSTNRAWVEERLGAMTVEEKVGQLFIGYFEGPVLSPELHNKIINKHFGGVILYNITGNITNSPQTAGLVRDIQTAALANGQIPLFIALDQEGGRVVRLAENEGVTEFPGNMALGATGRTDLAAEAAAVMAGELRALGINMNFAPVLDVNSNPANPIISTRSFGSSPANVALFGGTVVKAIQEQGIIATAKHFPGHGDTNTDSHLGLPVVNKDLGELEKGELVPFRAVAKDVSAVMTAHILVPSLDPERPATLSPILLDLLRNQLGFGGLIITDSLGMGAITKHWSLEEAAVQAFLAGADVLLYGADAGSRPEDSEKAFEAVVRAVYDGRISMERLDASVRRILMTKEQFGIRTAPFPKAAVTQSGVAFSHAAVAEHVAIESITLVKNNQGVLPLLHGRRVPLFWPVETAEQAGPLLKQIPGLTPCFLPIKPTRADIDQAVSVVHNAPVVLVGTYNLHRNTKWAELVQSLDAEKVIALAVRSPYDLLYIPRVAGYVTAYDDGFRSMDALGRVLKGEINPRGRLPVDLTGYYPLGWGMGYDTK